LGVAFYNPVYSWTRDCGLKAGHRFLEAMKIVLDLLLHISKVLVALDTWLENNIPPVLALFGGDKVSDAQTEIIEFDQPPPKSSAEKQTVQEHAQNLKEAENILKHSHEPVKTPIQTAEDYLSYDPYWPDDASPKTQKKSAKPAAPIWRLNITTRTGPPSAAGTAMMAQKMAWRAMILNRTVLEATSQESAGGAAMSVLPTGKEEAQSQLREETLSLTKLPPSVKADQMKPLTTEPDAVCPNPASPAPESVPFNPEVPSIMPDTAPNGPTLVFAAPDSDSCSDEDEFDITSEAAEHLDVRVVEHTGYLAALEKRCSVSEQFVAELEAENAQLREKCKSLANHLQVRIDAEMARTEEEKRERIGSWEETAGLSRKITVVERIMTQEQNVQLTTEMTSPNEWHQVAEDDKMPQRESGKAEEML
jgi:hypothetical protein